MQCRPVSNISVTEQKTMIRIHCGGTPRNTAYNHSVNLAPQLDQSFYILLVCSQLINSGTYAAHAGKSSCENFLGALPFSQMNYKSSLASYFRMKAHASWLLSGNKVCWGFNRVEKKIHWGHMDDFLAFVFSYLRVDLQENLGEFLQTCKGQREGREMIICE